ncbi:MAG: cactus-binding C-terminus of cactin protein-domain-containing protein [Linnemannia elongata]|nr:MAG: cactus-binding C-terminus of cactin protein-domain-containing protein [Linnemannia elongata]
MANRSRSRSKDRRDRHRDTRASSRSRSPARREPSRRDSSHDRHRADDRHKESRRDNRDRDRDREKDRNKDDRSRRHNDGGSRRRRESDNEDDRGRDRDHKKKSRKDDEPGRKPRETSEERAARKELRKKEKEEQKKSLEIAMTNYSNSDNPFNDANLAQKFTWAKKREVEKKKGISSAESARRDVIRRQEAKIELEKLNQKRAEREREREEREEEMLRIQRASEQAQLGDWQAQEEEFHLKQAKRRAEIRIKSNRAKPIDILAMNIKLISDVREEDEEEDEDDIGLEIDVDEPYTIFDNLDFDEVQELSHDIKFYLSLDKDERCAEFWRAMLIVCEDKLNELDTSKKDQGVVAPNIAQEMSAKMAGKTLEELTLLQGQITRKLGGGGVIDVEYWEALLKTLVVWKAKAKLNEIHQVILQKRLDQLKARQMREAEKEKAELAAVLAMQSQDVEGNVSGLREVGEEHTEYIQEGEDIDLDGLLGPSVPYDRAMSPEPFDTLSREDQDFEVVDQWEDWAEILDKRRQVLNKQFNPKKRNQEQDAGEQHPDDDFVSKILHDKEAAKQLAGNEQTFNIEASLQRQQTYMWQDKYRPRKPRFFNRVHTGYEWNKYNQTHYDHDNPPPKVVQGYKFNLFYPDLIDKSQAPTYEIVKEPGTEDTVLIKFKSGPPYEDIAFRIVNREWEFSHKRGYKSVFDRGVLQLHFNFKRQFYRR